MAKRINVKLILELNTGGMSQDMIARTRHMSRSSVSTVVNIAKTKDISFEDIRGMNDDVIYQMFFPEKLQAEQMYQLPDYENIHTELKRVGVTLKLLWQEYKDDCHRNAAIPVGYTKFCDDYGRYTSMNEITNHLEHKPGERCEVDWSGKTMKIVSQYSEKAIPVYLFVSCLTYSRFAYVEPTLDMKMDTWMRCHVRMYESFGGVPIRTICDNLKTGVVKHPREGEIVLTDAYEALGTHYITAIMPAGIRKPRQKAAAEGTVRDVETAVIAKLRDREFHDYPSLQLAVRAAVDGYNKAPFEKRTGSREKVLREEEQAFLRPLPSIPYEIATVENDHKVYPNSHVALNKNWYSVPYIYRGRYVDIRYTEKTVEIYFDHQRIATHPKFPDYITNRYDTTKSDMPDEFNQPEMDEERIRSWAATIGTHTAEVIDRIFRSVQIREQGYNAALSVLKLSQHYPNERFEDACLIALSNTASPRYKYLKAILSSNQDILIKERAGRMLPKENHSAEERQGAYVRGADYYAGDGHDQ
jgi:transposase